MFNFSPRRRNREKPWCKPITDLVFLVSAHATDLVFLERVHGTDLVFLVHAHASLFFIVQHSSVTEATLVRDLQYISTLYPLEHEVKNPV